MCRSTEMRYRKFINDINAYASKCPRGVRTSEPSCPMERFWNRAHVGRQFFVENVGGGGNIGMGRAAKAAPERLYRARGHSELLHQSHVLFCRLSVNWLSRTPD